MTEQSMFKQSMFSGMTHGEKRVYDLAQKLSDEHFYYVPEPILNDEGSSRRPDGVMICYEFGVAVIEIKDWKNVLDVNQKQWKVKHRDGTSMEHSPVETAREYTRILLRLLEDESVLMHRRNGRRSLNIPWQEVVILPNMSQAFISYLEGQKIVPENILLGEDALVNSATFERALRNLPWKFKLDTPMSDGQRAAIRRVANPSLRVGDYGTLSPVQEFLSQEALETAESSTVRLVRGVAGSGKSLVLVRRAQWLKEQYPDQNLLVMNFNKDLTAELKKRVDNDAITVTNFHKICHDIIVAANRTWRSPNQIRGWLQNYGNDLIEKGNLSVEFVEEEIKWRKNIGLLENDDYLAADRKGRGTGLTRDKRAIINELWDGYRGYQARQKSRDEVWEDWEDIPYLAIDALEKKSNPYRDAFDVILLDEAQDFAPTWMQIVIRLLKPGGTLFLCDDPTQSIFGYFSWKEKGVGVQGRTKVLRVPFRSTREISTAAHALIDADPILSMSSDITRPLLESEELLSGNLPRLATCGNRDEEVVYVFNRVANLIGNGASPSDVAILSHEYKTHHWDGLKTQGVQIQSFYRMKGLEYSHVFVPFVNTLFQPQKGEEADEMFISKQRKALFTAMTRAREELTVSFHGVLPDALKCLREHTFRDHIDESFF